MHILTRILVEVFDLRRVQLCPRTEDSYEDAEIDEVESRVNQVTVDMIYRLNNQSFGPMFSTLQEWSTTMPTSSQSKDARTHRQITWYKFLHLFFEKVQVSTLSSTLGSSFLMLGSPLEPITQAS